MTHSPTIPPPPAPISHLIDMLQYGLALLAAPEHQGVVLGAPDRVLGQVGQQQGVLGEPLHGRRQDVLELESPADRVTLGLRQEGRQSLVPLLQGLQLVQRDRLAAAEGGGGRFEALPLLAFKLRRGGGETR